ncbi:hypothetical protein PG985_010389 [Apiospora marii]|uniref:uncharacterized protein n=1 Tax=Apiospora marii TaxID=335849 RepID=UPI00312EE609
MGFGQKSLEVKHEEDPLIDELEQSFAKLSMNAEENGHFKRSAKPRAQQSSNSRAQRSSNQSSAPNPFLKRQPTANELIDGIDKLQNLCREVQGKLDPYIEAEERIEMEKAKLASELNYVLNHL